MAFKGIVAAGKAPRLMSLVLFALIPWGASVTHAASQGSAQGRECPRPDVPPRIILETGFAKPRLDTSKSSTQLAAILDSQKGSSAVGNAVGLTSTRPAYSFQTRISANQVGGNQVGGQRYCVTLTDLTIRFKYENVLVYVARKYSAASCPYRVTLNHEMRHVTLYRQGYEAFLPLLNARAKAVADEVNPMKASSLAMARRVHLERIQKALEPAFQTFFGEQRARNLEMDTPQAYGLERDKCRDW
ncbi:MAG: hypothetical protein K9H25_10170 [Rhodospirillum sp.]|nr:hypothetical protein [Rhodospirillum sp.]MCF8490319.1 hypothetical protein [Rhodospirillum sp.]MCF8500159.1 hypothetical protein [Rhodospirillum sp.]